MRQHRLGELAAFLVADVAGRRADQPGDAVLFHVFRHVDADHRPLVVEEELGEGLGQLGLADAGGAEEDERADRPPRVLDPRAGADHRVGDQLHRLLLAHHPLVEDLVEAQQLLALALDQPRHRDAGPLGDDLGDLLLGHLLAQQLVAAAVDAGLLLAQLCLELRQLAVLELRRAVEVVLALGVLDLPAHCSICSGSARSSRSPPLGLHCARMRAPALQVGELAAKVHGRYCEALSFS